MIFCIFLIYGLKGCLGKLIGNIYRSSNILCMMKQRWRSELKDLTCTLKRFLASCGEESQGCICKGCFILTESGGNFASKSTTDVKTITHLRKLYQLLQMQKRKCNQKFTKRKRNDTYLCKVNNHATYWLHNEHSE